MGKTALAVSSAFVWTALLSSRLVSCVGDLSARYVLKIISRSLQRKPSAMIVTQSMSKIPISYLISLEDASETTNHEYQIRNHRLLITAH